MFEAAEEPQEPQEPPGGQPAASDPPAAPPLPERGAAGEESAPEASEGPGESDAPDETEVDPLGALAEAQCTLQRAEAARAVALLNAYEDAMAEMQAVFGPDGGDRDGPFARSFLLEAAQLLHLTERSVGVLFDTAEALRRSFPQSWAMFTAGRVCWREAELVWRQAQGLEPDGLPDFDRAAAELLGEVPVSRLKDRLHRLRELLQADTATGRHTAAMEDRCVRVEPAPDGMAWLSLYGDAAELLAFDDALAKAAVAAHGIEGERRTLAHLRYDIARDLLLEGIKQPAGEADGLRVPGRKGVQPVAYLTIPVLTALGHSDEPPSLAGYGPIGIERAKELAGEAKGWIRILTDPVTGVRLSMDRAVYTPPPDLKRWLRVRDETCRAPGCNRRAAGCDIDHVAGWAQNGRTEGGNLAHLCRRHHRMKGSGYWGTALDADGSMIWDSWWKRRYVTDPADHPEGSWEQASRSSW